ncbi:hypothetical protein EOS_14665 [Caballeronia mineralivorans PML1(12)]|uniref:Cell wall surface anchor family protein n=1 Tax=Caballeronia mineralivorans PML1(12) TaxID=908627 RepID=A0A0J1CXX3_9BURK|nr:hypothetical protein [Caballeronia mineralivorans]KLU25407.1 hypothetical protein EOS_14665 [Caballeronia mineralivorans PML1(12)]
MPDSAVNPARQSVDAAGSRRADAASASASARRPVESDADAKLARAARSAQRLALLSRAPYGAPTLDLFAEDAERATLQVLNTDIRQSTLPGFELPEAFMAAVSATASADEGSSASVRPVRSGVVSARFSEAADIAAPRDAAAVQTENKIVDAATLELMFDDVGAPHSVVAGPVQPESPDDGAGSAPVVAALDAANAQGSNKRASAARTRGAARNVAVTEPSSVATARDVETASRGVADAAGETGDGVTENMNRSPNAGDAPGARNVTTAVSAPSAPNEPNAPDARNAAIKPAAPLNNHDTARATANPHRHPPQSLAAALIDDDRRTRSSTASSPPAASTPARDASELDTARATAYADTIDALYAVIADQRSAAAALSRRVKTVLMIVICVLLVTVATGVAQTIALIRLTGENTAQQQRIEQLMLNQQATLASFFDTDSSIVEVPSRGNANASTADKNPGTAAHSAAAKRAHSKAH